MKGLSLWSGIIALIIGLFLFIHPFTTTAMIGWIIAIIIFLSGFTSLFMYSSSVNRSLWYLLQGILSIVFGIILLSSSVMSLSSAVMTIVAYWILISGILRLIGGFQMKKAGFFDANRFLGSAVLAILLGKFTPRGGLSIDPYFNYGKPGTKYEKMADYRLMNHDLYPGTIDNR